MNTDKKIKLILTFLTLIFAAYQTYTAFYPTDSFYEDQFEYNTNLEFPKSGEIIAKDASYPDIHGDYSAAALFKLNDEDFQELFNLVQKDKNYDVSEYEFGFSSRIKEQCKNYNKRNFIKSFVLNRTDRDLTFCISFNSKDKLIEFERDSW